MIRFGRRAHGDARSRTVKGIDISVIKGEWMECGDDPNLSPTISLIEQPPNSTLPAHFHRQNQFQLFVAGSGRLGPTPIEPVSIHYAGAYTGYGPLIAGPSGIKYFTMRPVCESGAIPVTEARTEMVRGPKRHAHAGPVRAASQSELAALEKPDFVPEIRPGVDGMGATTVLLPPGAQLNVQGPDASAGTFVVVLAGTLHAQEERDPLEVWESMFSTADETPVAVTAGALGAQVVLLHVPAKDAAYATSSR